MDKVRIAVIDYKKCRPDICGKVCIKSCPMVRTGVEAIFEENKQIQIAEELCTGCGICIKRCPFKAIKIVNIELKLDSPIHQYGKNRFRLFNIVNIRDKQTVGIIGKNAIGKSTIMKILSGQITPNLGDLDIDPSYDPVIDRFKGKEQQNIFQNLKEKRTKVAYKPQNIELIPNTYKGKVMDLLKKADTDNKINEIIEKFKMENILDKNISELSGGELQKLAIAATWLKDADFYFYDEPSSFLDIKQRFLFTDLIQNDENTNILIEHDLAILDYISDYLHILFGKPHVYGIVSNIKSPNLAINEFLDGFIKDDNIRFRNYQIDFVYRDERTAEKKEILFEYPEIEKSYKGFELKVEKGKIFRGEVVCILGENGIGKTTFIKQIAGVEEPDKGKISHKLKIAYKPQGLFQKELMEETVKDFLKNTNQEILNTYIKGRFNLDYIKEYKLKELNGGDLQKVFIAKTLATDADIYLFDEPSAYLDVEERLNVAKMIRQIIAKRKKSAFVVDHDILFCDYISDKLTVFTGTPGKEGYAKSPGDKKAKMNEFLKILNISYRMDPNSKRPRINKFGSVKDNEQKKSGNYYTY
jgi:ATP-binding cassette, sub-family E, member 1